jgi:hypothetical protein
MKRLSFAAALTLLAFTASGWAADPLVGTWQLDHQELNGQRKESEPLTLRITAADDKFTFAFAVLVNNIDFVSMTYTTKLDGSEADVKNSQGVKIGVVEVTTTQASHYKLLLKGINRPETTGTLTISRDGNTLTSETDTTVDGHTSHLVQAFSRH